MMKCYCTKKIILLQNAALIAITRDAKIWFALFILIMSIDWYNASFVSLLNWKPCFYLATENCQYPSKEKRNSKTIVCYYQRPGLRKQVLFQIVRGPQLGLAFRPPTCKKTRHWEGVIITFLKGIIFFSWPEIASDHLQSRRKLL